VPKLVVSNGLSCQVWDVGPCLLAFDCQPGVPLPAGVNEIMTDDEARAFARGLAAQGFPRADPKQD
jgi:hypothetical protein